LACEKGLEEGMVVELEKCSRSPSVQVGVAIKSLLDEASFGNHSRMVVLKNAN